MKKKLTAPAFRLFLPILLVLFTSTVHTQIMWSQNCRAQDEVGRIPGTSSKHCCEIIIYCRDISGKVEGHVVQTDKAEMEASMLNLFKLKVDADYYDSIVVDITKGNMCRALHYGLPHCKDHDEWNGSPFFFGHDACDKTYNYETIGGTGTLKIYTNKKVAGELKGQIKNVEVKVDAESGEKVKITVTGEFCSKEARDHKRCDKRGFDPYGEGWTLDPTTFAGLDENGKPRFSKESETAVREADKKAKETEKKNEKVVKKMYSLNPINFDNSYNQMANEVRNIPTDELRLLLGMIAYNNMVYPEEINRTFYKEQYQNLNRVAMFDGAYFNVPQNVINASLDSIRQGTWDFTDEWNTYSTTYGTGNIVSNEPSVKKYFSNRETQIITGNVVGPSTITVAGGNVSGYVMVTTKDTTAKLPIDKATGHVKIPGDLLKKAGQTSAAVIEVFNEAGNLLMKKQVNYQSGLDMYQPPVASNMPEIIQTNNWTTIPVDNIGPHGQLVINDQPQPTLASSQNELTPLITAPPGDCTAYVENPSGQTTPQHLHVFSFEMSPPGAIRKGQTISIPYTYEGMPPNSEIDFTNYSDNVIVMPQNKTVVTGKGQGTLQVTGKSNGNFSIGYDFKFVNTSH